MTRHTEKQWMEKMKKKKSYSLLIYTKKQIDEMIKKWRIK